MEELYQVQKVFWKMGFDRQLIAEWESVQLLPNAEPHTTFLSRKQLNTRIDGLNSPNPTYDDIYYCKFGEIVITGTMVWQNKNTGGKCADNLGQWWREKVTTEPLVSALTLESLNECLNNRRERRGLS